ncbi:MAG: bifunctional DNA-formamidopyrimidine glycosylase/DNA-(apurinic or apyrimidinic site) lyase [Moorellales bacterium]
MVRAKALGERVSAVPELPEVETIRRSLEPWVVGQEICRTEVYDAKTLVCLSPADFCRRLAGAEIKALHRRGKYLLFHLEPQAVLVAHLGMTGQLIWQPEFSGPSRHTRAVWALERGFLVFEDLRRFGRIWLVPPEELAEIRGLANLGPEPLDGGLHAETLLSRVRGQRRPLKALLLDQRFLAGIGNIYADEILYRAGLDPRRPAASLTRQEAERLVASVREVLEEAVEHRGTSVRDYVDGRGNEGEHQNFLRVYGRAGKPCPQCGGAIDRAKIGGRGTHFCPRCQY